ncbi:MAG: type II secretion system protein [Alphaproteobacteria bacterium]|nr:type II secretion system protein [Alphaproteobacteria bacterium]
MGFSLPELAIVLAIMGLVLGSLWGVVSMVRENVRRQEMVEQMVVMVNNIRDFYSNRIRVTDAGGGTGFAAITSYLLQQSVLLPEQIRNRSAAILLADHPWGSSAPDNSVLSNGGIGVDGSTDSSQFFRIRLRGIKYSSCISLADKLSGADMPLGLVSVTINASAAHTILPVSPDVATTECRKAPGGEENTMDFVYRLRKQDTK